MSKVRAHKALKLGVVLVDPPPSKPTILGAALRGDAQAAWTEYIREYEAWQARKAGAELVGFMKYAVEQWEQRGLDLGAIMHDIADGKAPVLANALWAMTERPKVEVRKPRQGKSKWTTKEQAELILAVRREQLLSRAREVIITNPKDRPKISVTQACRKLSGRSGPEKWRHDLKKPRITKETDKPDKPGTSLEARYREAKNSPLGQCIYRMTIEAERAREQGRISTDELEDLFKSWDRAFACV